MHSEAQHCVSDASLACRSDVEESEFSRLLSTSTRMMSRSTVGICILCDSTTLHQILSALELYQHRHMIMSGNTNRLGAR